MSLIGWDIGGAHLKGARIEGGRIVNAVQVACPLWKGLAEFDNALAAARAALGAASRHGLTMTGELSDVFASRADGVAELSRRIAAALPEPAAIYGGRAGWLEPEAAAARADDVASANWHAAASWLAAVRPDALFVDMGSTTTDIIPVSGGNVAARGYSDAERLLTGELAYTGATRTFLMAVAQRVPFRGAWTPVMNEYFASMADAHRLTGELPEDSDRHPTADNRAKTVNASAARLARSIGRDPAEAELWEWRGLAHFFTAAQLRTIEDCAMQVLSAQPLAADAPVVGAGTGRFAAARLAQRLGRPFELWADSAPGAPELVDTVGDCAPAVAVALLLDRDLALGSLP